MGGPDPAHIGAGGFLSTPNGNALSFFFGGFGFADGTGGAIFNNGIATSNLTITDAGKTYDHSCSFGFAPFCTYLSEGAASMHANSPPPSPLTTPPTPFTGPSQVTVPGTFSLFISGGVVGPTGAPFLGFEFHGSGAASLTFDAIIDPPSALACAQYPQLCGAPLWREWQFDPGFAQIKPTPEPATFLLFATTAAGLGLVRRYRRRSHAHAA